MMATRLSETLSPATTSPPPFGITLPPEERSRWWRGARFGAFFHWGLYTIPARSEWILAEEHIPVAEYEKLLPHFHAQRFNPRAWARRVKAAGMKYAVFTTKHHDGFCLFPSRLTKFNCRATPSRRDFTREFVEAFRAEGLGVGLYYSVPDWHHPAYPLSPGHPVRPLALPGWRSNEPLYFRYLLGQVRELLSNYGPIDLLWFDHPYSALDGARLVREIRALQPNILVNDRANIPPSERDWESPEQWIPRGQVVRNGRPVVWECTATMTGGYWGYDRQETNYRSPAQLVRMLVRCAAGGGNLLLNLGPCADGSISGKFSSRLREVGNWLARNGESIYDTEAGPDADWPHGRITRRGSTLYLHVFDWPANGRLPLPRLSGHLHSACLLDGSPLALVGKTLRVPSRPPDPLGTVLRIDYDRIEERPQNIVSAAERTAARKLAPAHAVTCAAPVCLDGEVGETPWLSARAIRFSSETHYDYTADLDPQLARGSRCAAELRMIHDRRVFYASVEVESELPLAREKNYLGDSVEFFFAAGDTGTGIILKYASPSSHARFHLVIGCDGSALVASEKSVPGLVFRHAVKRTESGYRVVLALPLAMLWKKPDDPSSSIRPGDIFRMNLVVNQATPTAIDHRFLAGRPRRSPLWWRRDPHPSLFSHKCRHRIYWNGKSLEDQMAPSSWARVRIER
jgi:alpha-L-fucosidase